MVSHIQSCCQQKSDRTQYCGLFGSPSGVTQAFVNTEASFGWFSFLSTMSASFKASTECTLPQTMMQIASLKSQPVKRSSGHGGERMGTQHPGIRCENPTTSFTAGVKLMENSSQIPLPKARGPPCGDLLSDKSDHLPPRLPNNCSCSCSEKIHLPQPHHAFPENKIGEVHTMSICSTTGCPLGCCSTCCPSSCPLTLTSCRLSQGKGCSAHSTVSGPKLHCSLSWGILGPCAPH